MLGKTFHSSRSDNFIRPDAKAVKGVDAERRCHGDIRRIPASRQEDPADAGNIVARVERMPMSTKISLKPRREITGWMRRRRAGCPAHGKQSDSPSPTADEVCSLHLRGGEIHPEGRKTTGKRILSRLGFK